MFVMIDGQQSEESYKQTCILGEDSISVKFDWLRIKTIPIWFLIVQYANLKGENMGFLQENASNISSFRWWMYFPK